VGDPLALAGLLEGRVAIVAGGGGAGIGAAVSRALAGAGASVLVVDIDARAAGGVCEQIHAAGGRAEPLLADVCESASAPAIVAAARRAFGRIDILATVAGGMTAHAQFRPLIQWNESDWDRIVSLNLRYVFLLTRAVIPAMLEQGEGGAIVNVTSISGVFGAVNHAAYGAAKAGLIHLTRTLCLEYGPQGIRANAVSPGAIETPATQKALAGTQRTHVSAVTPLRRAGRPEDIAHAVLFLASPLASYVSGQMLLVDGGASVIFPLGTPGESR
jgi:3-oxoacyl-[acyl-carrier protein] reductase